MESGRDRVLAIPLLVDGPKEGPVLADVTVTGLPALLIILLVLAIIVAGVVTLTRASARGVKKAAKHLDSDRRAPSR